MSKWGKQIQASNHYDMEFYREAVAVQICLLPTVVQLKVSYHMRMAYG